MLIEDAGEVEGKRKRKGRKLKKEDYCGVWALKYDPHAGLDYIIIFERIDLLLLLLLLL